MDTCYVDLDGTLLVYDAPFAAVYADALERLGVDPRGVEAYSEAFFAVLGDADDPFAAAIAETDVDVDPAAFSDAMLESETAHVRTVPKARDVLEALAADYRLGVLTNGVGRVQRAKLEAVGLADAVEAVVVSGEVGARKPNPEIYRIAEERLPGDSFAFVADDLERDVHPAVEVGWRGIYVGDEHVGDERVEDESGGDENAAGDRHADVQRVDSLEGVPDLL